jgi:hypothetical protein
LSFLCKTYLVRRDRTRVLWYNIFLKSWKTIVLKKTTRLQANHLSIQNRTMKQRRIAEENTNLNEEWKKEG